MRRQRLICFAQGMPAASTSIRGQPTIAGEASRIFRKALLQRDNARIPERRRCSRLRACRGLIDIARISKRRMLRARRSRPSSMDACSPRVRCRAAEKRRLAPDGGRCAGIRRPSLMWTNAAATAIRGGPAREAPVEVAFAPPSPCGPTPQRPQSGWLGPQRPRYRESRSLSLSDARASTGGCGGPAHEQPAHAPSSAQHSL